MFTGVLKVSGFGCQNEKRSSRDLPTALLRKSEPQNIEQEISNDEVRNRCVQSFFKNNNGRKPYFDIYYSLFDIRYSFFQGFYLLKSADFLAAAGLKLETRHLKPQN